MPALTIEEYHMHEEEMNGLCLNCGAVRYGMTEPDACNYPCEECGENEVFGFQECLLMGKLGVT